MLFRIASSFRKEIDEKKRDKIRKILTENKKDIRNFEDLINLEDEEVENLSRRIERTLPIFEALTESKYGQKRDRYFANLGYVLKDKKDPNWEEALKMFNKAIKLSEKPQTHYYFNKAICLIEISNKEPESVNTREVQESLKKSLDENNGFYKLKNSICDQYSLVGKLVSDWCERNNIPLSTMMCSI